MTLNAQTFPKEQMDLGAARPNRTFRSDATVLYLCRPIRRPLRTCVWCWCDREVDVAELNVNGHRWHSTDRGQKEGAGQDCRYEALGMCPPCPLCDRLIFTVIPEDGKTITPTLQTRKPSLGERQ